MLKWLSGSSAGTDHHRPHRSRRQRTSKEIVTDDPLATIRVHKVDRPLEIYAVSRVNPIFDEEEDDIQKFGGGNRRFLYHPQQHTRKDHGSPEFPGKSASSGYGSNRYNSSSEYSSSGAEENTASQHRFAGSSSEDESARARCGDPRISVLRDDAITVVEQNVGFVKSILVAVRGNNASPRTSIGRHNRRPSGASAATLSPIPEGKIDYTIPRPVWPKEDDNRKLQVQPKLPNPPQLEQHQTVVPTDSLVDDALLLYTSFTYAPSLPSDGAFNVAQDGISTAVNDHTSVGQISASKQHTITSHEILRELSTTLNEAMQAKNPEEVIKGLHSKLDELQKIPLTPSSEEALRNLSMTLSHREPLLKMARALSNSSSSCSGGSTRAANSAQDDGDTARLLLLQRLGATPTQWQKRCDKSDSRTYRTSRTNTCPLPAPRKNLNNNVDRGSTSSSTISSGFSDLTQTTPSSSNSPSSRRGGDQTQVLANPPVFLHDDLSSVPNSVRNAMIYGTLCRLNMKNGAYEKLLSSQKNGASGKSDEKDDTAKVPQDKWETYKGTGVKAGDVHMKQTNPYFYPSPERPDFTLDMHKAERLMRKIQSAKRRRCWCRLITSFLGLVFFLLSVIVVSMLITRGKRVFGPI